MSLDMIDHDALRDVLEIVEAEGFDVRLEYSGRGMYGRKCLGITTDNMGDMFVLGQLLHEHDWMGRPSTDSMGRSAIVYWPSVDTTDYVAETMHSDEEEEYEDA